MDDIQQRLVTTEQEMRKVCEHIQVVFSKISIGRAMPNMLDEIIIPYYGNDTPLAQIASINTPDARTLLITPWEKKSIPAIEKAIINSRLALIPQNDGEIIRLNISPLTEDGRKILVKQVKNETEHGKVSLRNIRKKTKEVFRRLHKEEKISEDVIKKSEDKLQKMTDQYIHQLDQLMIHKEHQIMEL